MPKPTVFISYSQEDKEWKDHLVNHLGVLRHQGLLDLWEDSRIGAGGDWYQEIQRAMDAASVAILLVSADFLNSQLILNEEVPRLLERQRRAGLRIFPVIVRPCLWKHVEWLARMQVRPGDDRPLSAGNEHQRDADLAAIAEEVVTIIEQPRKPPPRFKGPRYVEFVVVAGRADELTGVRTNVDSYGDECVDWRPYYPDFEKRVGPFIQNVAGDEDFTSNCLRLSDFGDELEQALEQAQEKKSIVVVIVDVWTIRLPTYHNLMREYDKRSLLNCAVLIPWNSQDDETKRHRDKLETALRVTFVNKMVAKDPKSFREEIVSPEQLESELRDVIIEIGQRILESREVARKAVGEGVIVQPQISGPGGGEP